MKKFWPSRIGTNSAQASQNIPLGKDARRAMANSTKFRKLKQASSVFDVKIEGIVEDRTVQITGNAWEHVTSNVYWDAERGAWNETTEVWDAEKVL